MINFNPQTRPEPSDIFQFNAWMDSINDPAFLWKGKVVDMINMDFNDYGPVGREGLTLKWQAGTWSVTAEGVIKKDAGDILVRIDGVNFQKLVWSTWTNVTTVTAGFAFLVSYQCSDLTTAASLTGTATADSSSKILVVSGGSMTINAYAGKIVRITSGTGAGQENLISWNDITDIFVESSWETIPDATSVFDIRNSAPHVIFTNGTDVPFKYDGTTKTNLTNWVRFHTLDVAHDRLFGAREDIDYVYISNLGTDFFPKDNYIPVNQNWDSISNVSRNHEEVVIYKYNSRYRLIGADLDSFQLVTADEKIGCIAPHSVAHGNNYNFFLGYEGIFSINSLDNSSTDEGIPISLDINNLVLAHTANELANACGWIENNKYHISIGNEVFVYHIAQSQIAKSHCWSRYSYADPIKSALVYSGVVYLGWIQSYTVWGTTDNGTTITCTVITGTRAQKDKNRNKIYHRDYINFKPTNTVVSIYVGIDGATPSLIWTFTAINGQMRMMVNKRGRTIQYKYTFPATNSPEMQTHETFFSYLSKSV